MSKTAMTWKPLLGLGALALLLVTAYGCGGDEDADTAGAGGGALQITSSLDVSEDTVSQPPAAQPAAESGQALRHGSGDATVQTLRGVTQPVHPE